jgi:hypothetical protein
MRRACQQIIVGRASLADTILALYRHGTVKRRFSASQIEHLLTGVFSDNEIRYGLGGLVGHYHATPADERFREIEKYRYEIVD